MLAGKVVLEGGSFWAVVAGGGCGGFWAVKAGCGCGASGVGLWEELLEGWGLACVQQPALFRVVVRGGVAPTKTRLGRSGPARPER